MILYINKKASMGKIAIYKHSAFLFPDVFHFARKISTVALPVGWKTRARPAKTQLPERLANGRTL